MTLAKILVPVFVIYSHVLLLYKDLYHRQAAKKFPNIEIFKCFLTDYFLNKESKINSGKRSKELAMEHVLFCIVLV